jgi:hypothetical protein
MVTKTRRAAFVAAMVGLAGLGCGERREQPAKAAAVSAAAEAATGSMSTPRSIFQALALPDGKVLVVGGTNSELPRTGHVAELYDPATGAFQPTGSLHAGRSAHGAALLPGGRVLVTSGCPDDAGSSIPDEVWDPSTGAWTIVGSSAPRHEPAVVSLANGKVLVAGGGDCAGVAYHGDARVFDPESGSFAVVASLLTPRESATATLLADGRVLVAGGLGASGSGQASPFLASAELFDPASGSFGAAKVMNVARVQHTATRVADGRVLVIGGVGEKTTELYDPATNTWAYSASLKTPRDSHGAALLDDGSVVILGGQKPGAVLSSVERWTPGAGMLSGDALTWPRRSFGLAPLPGGTFLIAGGIDGSGYTRTAAVYAYGCTPTSTCFGGWCGPHLDDCGGTMECGGCDAGAACTGGLCCVPLTCASVGQGCGTFMDGCGGTVSCGCQAGQVCRSSTCCTPATCASLGRNCGTVTDGCGGSLSCGACGVDEVCSAGGVCQPVPGIAVYDPTLQAPRCAAAGALCDSGALLTGRAGLGPEPHAPNTLRASCADGTSGAFHANESIDRLRISAIGGGALAPGTGARIEASVWATQVYDSLYLYTTADATAAAPVWTFLTNIYPSGTGAQTLTATFAVPAGGSEVKAIRAVFRYADGTASGPCPGGPFTDVDDLVFSAGLLPDSAPPAVSITSPAPGTLTGGVSITVTATDDVGVVGVSCSDGSRTVGSSSAYPFKVYWNTRLSTNGAHALTCTATDVAGNSTTSAPVNVVVQNDLVPPTIAFTAPAPGAALSGTVSLRVQASDDVGVVRVDYQLDGASLTSSTTAPFAVSWNVNYTANGPHTLTAVARDAAGNTASATLPVTVAHDATPPAVSITAPAPGAIVGGTVVVSATATDDTGVTAVYFYVDGAYVGAASTAPYQIAWNTTGATTGAHALQARAYDACGNVGTSAAVNVTVRADAVAPTVSVTSPSAGAVLSGTVKLSASATDNVGVTLVQFFDNGTSICEVSVAPWSCSWNTSSAANGSHAITARARDAALNVGQSAAVTVTVSNGSPGQPGQTAVWDASLKAPRCGAGVSCDSGTLLLGRAGLGPEPGAPNTLFSSCADGSSGSFHGDESLDRLVVSTLDGTPLAAGKTVRVAATVWAYAGYGSDKLDLYYTATASSPSWTFIGTLSPTAAGAQTLSTTFTLPAGALQAVRGTFRYGGSAGPCTSGGYDDHDDLVFAVQ